MKNEVYKGMDMNRKKRKLIYIRIKNSWKKYLKYSNIIDITMNSHNFLYNPKNPTNRIIMDFKNREEIVKYGIKRIC
jgi:hypothetical protein